MSWFLLENAENKVNYPYFGFDIDSNTGQLICTCEIDGGVGTIKGVVLTIVSALDDGMVRPFILGSTENTLIGLVGLNSGHISLLLDINNKNNKVDDQLHSIFIGYQYEYNPIMLDGSRKDIETIKQIFMKSSDTQRFLFSHNCF